MGGQDPPPDAPDPTKICDEICCPIAAVTDPKPTEDNPGAANEWDKLNRSAAFRGALSASGAR